MKNTYFTFILFLYSCIILSQTIENPSFTSSSDQYLNIDSIDILKNKTILYFSYENQYDKDSWVNINDKVILKDNINNQIYELIEAKGIEISPKKTLLSHKGQIIYFSLIFEKLNKKTISFDFIECPQSNCFYIKDLKLFSNSKKNINATEFSDLEELFKSNQYEKLLETSLFLKKNRNQSNKLDYYLGISYGIKKNFELATKYLENYLFHYPEDEKMYSILGQFYVNLEKYNDALPHLEKGILIGDEYCYFLKGICHFKLNQIDLSLSNFEKFSKYERSEKNDGFYFRYAMCFLEKANTISETDYLGSKANFNLTIINLKKAIQINPSNYEYCGNLGLVYMMLDDYENALIYMNKSLELNPEQIELKEYISTINKLINVNKIKLKKENDVFLIPATLNNSITVDFIFDSGASEVLVSPEIVGLLLKRNLINKNDILEDGYFKIADGTIIKLKRFIIRDFKIGNKNLKDINCTVANELYTDILLGQSVLSKLGKYTFDYKNLILEIN